MKSRNKRNLVFKVLALSFFLFGVVLQVYADRLDDVIKRGSMIIGIAPNSPGFSSTDNQGKRMGFDIDLTKAISAAILGAPDKTQLRPVKGKQAFPGLKSGSLDALVHRFTWTLSRDAGSLNYTRVMNYDGQGFLVRKDLGVKKISDLDGAVLCVSQGSTSELNVTDYFRKNGLTFELLAFQNNEQALTAYGAKRCDAMTTDSFGLAAHSQKLPDREQHVILPERISKEPIGPLVAHGEDRLGDAIRWTLNALIAAEELGITQANVDGVKKTSNNPEVKRLLGVTGKMGSKLGLANDWAYKAIKAVGNYGEIWNRNLGPDTPLGLDRGVNALWTDGGLMMSMPFR
jgi:general L-amino acid transport system substrate-binding protein